MSIWNWLWGGSAHQIDAIAPAQAVEVNPATGLPMLYGQEGVDVGGSPFGMDWQKNDFFSPVSHFDAGCDVGTGLGDDWP